MLLEILRSHLSGWIVLSGAHRNSTTRVWALIGVWLASGFGSDGVLRLVCGDMVPLSLMRSKGSCLLCSSGGQTAATTGSTLHGVRTIYQPAHGLNTLA